MKKLFFVLLFMFCGLGFMTISQKTSALSPYTVVDVGDFTYGGNPNTVSPYTWCYFSLSSFNGESDTITILTLQDYITYGYVDFGLKLDNNTSDSLGTQVLYFDYYDYYDGVKSTIIIDGADNKLPNQYLYLLIIETNYTYKEYQRLHIYVIDYDLTDIRTNYFYNSLYIYKHITIDLSILVNGDSWESYMTEQVYLFDRRITIQTYAYGTYNDSMVLSQVKRNYSSGYLETFISNGYVIGSYSSTFEPNWFMSLFESIDGILSIHLLPNITIGTLLLIPLALGLISLILVFWRKD